MATWITHLMIADGVLERIPNLQRHRPGGITDVFGLPHRLIHKFMI